MRGLAVFCILPFQRRLATIWQQIVALWNNNNPVHSFNPLMHWLSNQKHVYNFCSQCKYRRNKLANFWSCCRCLVCFTSSGGKKENQILEKPNWQASMKMTQKLTICKEKREQTKSKKLRTSEWLNDKRTIIIRMFNDLQQTCTVMVLTSFFYPSIWTTGLHRQLPANGWRFKSVKT